MFAGDLLATDCSYLLWFRRAMEIPFYGLLRRLLYHGRSPVSLSALLHCCRIRQNISCAQPPATFASAEKEFRFPLGYGNQRPLSATWTVTGCRCLCTWQHSLLSLHPENPVLCAADNSCIAITGLTTGRLVDYGLKDSMNMGGCMAPAACDTIASEFSGLPPRQPADYDAIFTGDLGAVGQKILIDLLYQKGYDICSCHQDCGILIYDSQKQDTHSGGSGCGCAASSS